MEIFAEMPQAAGVGELWCQSPLVILAGMVLLWRRMSLVEKRIGRADDKIYPDRELSRDRRSG